MGVEDKGIEKAASADLPHSCWDEWSREGPGQAGKLTKW